jgi:hypothetical protein
MPSTSNERPEKVSRADGVGKSRGSQKNLNKFHVKFALMEKFCVETENDFLCVIFCRDSQKHIDYLEKQILNPLIEFERKTGKIIVAKKDRKTLEKIYGIIETNATYLTQDNSIAGKFIGELN